MALPVGASRIGVTMDGDNFLNPDVKLKKHSSATDVDELARLGDVLAINQYRGVVFVGGVLPESFFTQNGDRIAGFLYAPFEKLSDAYLAALSRFGAPDEDNRILVLIVGSHVEETAPIELASQYVDIFGLGYPRVIMMGPSPCPVFNVCDECEGITINGLTLTPRNAPVWQHVDSTAILFGGITFRDCNLESWDDAGASGSASFLISKGMTGEIFLDNCRIMLRKRGLLNHTSNNDTSLFLLRECLVACEDSAGHPVFQGTTDLRGRIENCHLNCPTVPVVFKVVTSGHTMDIKVNGLTFDHTQANTLLTTGALTTRLELDNIIARIELEVELPIGDFTVAFNGFLRNSHLTAFRLNNPDLDLKNFTVHDVVGNLEFSVKSADATVEFTNVETVSQLGSISDARALFYSADGVVSPKVKDCQIGYWLFFTDDSAVFAGAVVGGASRGIKRVASMATPPRQCSLKNHIFLKQDFLTGNVVTSTFYPDVYIASTLLPPGGVDSSAPVLIHGVKSDGMLRSEASNLAFLTNRYVFVSQSSFTLRSPFTEALCPEVTNDDTNHIIVASVSILPSEKLSDRDYDTAATLYSDKFSGRFGHVTFGNPDRDTWLDGKDYKVLSPWLFRQAIYQKRYQGVWHVRIPGGHSFVDVTHPLIQPWSVFSILPEAGTTDHPFWNTGEHFRFTFSSNHTVRISLPDAYLVQDHLDIVVILATVDESHVTS
jgi:hypothetical protein